MPSRSRHIEFSQWETDLLVYEVASLILRRGTNNQLMLCVIGDSLSTLARDVLASHKCTVKRFIRDHERDFLMCGTALVPTAAFIGDESRLVLPAGLPEEHAAEYQVMAMEHVIERQNVVDEILCILTSERNGRSWVTVAHVISRLSNATREWLRERRWKVTTFISETPTFEISMPRVGRAKVRVAATATKEDSPAVHPESCAGVELARNCLRANSTVSTDASPMSSCQSSSGYVGSPAGALRHLIATTGAMALAEMLSQSAPEYYED